MSWAIGFDERWQRDVGYGVPAYCDLPGCATEIDRGLSYVCGGEPRGGDHGCGLFFCEKHLFYHRFRGMENGAQFCKRCIAYRPPFVPKPDHPDWTEFKMTDPSWKQWRIDNKIEAGEANANAIES